MIYACTLFFGFISLLAVIAVLAVAVSSGYGPGLSSRLRRWLGRMARATAFLSLLHYLENGPPEITQFVVTTSVVLTILWAIVVFIDARIQKDTGQEQGNEKNRNQNLY